MNTTGTGKELIPTRRIYLLDDKSHSHPNLLSFFPCMVIS